ncbi:MAG: hypothetical protein LBP63_11255 [Prevotellaceae bacterium]|jgi:regulator of protease activity HflC (stomatin/prohibitin superfamily)|nr:hypothetical protein [Prevotellaceae bacterium]
MKTFLILISILAIIYFIIATVGKSIKKASDKKFEEWQKKGGSSSRQPVRSGFIIWNSKLLLFIPAILLFLMLFLTVIPAQTCGVVITPGGVLQQTYKTGWHLINPVYSVKLMDKTAQVYTCASSRSVDKNSDDYKEYKAAATQSGTIWAPTVDGIKMGFDISASWRIDEEFAWWIYDNVSEQDGSNSGRFFWLEENVIKPKLKSSLALTASKYNPIEVYSNKRQDIQDEVFEKMKQDVQSYHLILEQIDIREVYYNEEYEKAINAKKLEEQRVLTLIEITKQKREQEIQAAIDKNIAIQKAEGEAKALQIKGQSVVNNPKIVELEWINKWNGILPTYMLGNSNGIMLNMNKQ